MTQPIFVVGTGRSGSTAFADLLCAHPQVAWLSLLLDRYPDWPEWNRRLMQAIDLPVIGRPIRRLFPPTEVYNFWNRHFRGFARPFRDLVAADVMENTRRGVHGAFEETRTTRRPRVVAKITGWPRIGFLGEIFPDAKFVHVLRDGRAVANSLLEVHFWHGWQGPHNWRFGLLPNEMQAEWEHHGRSFVALAGLTWRILVDAVEEAGSEISADRFKEVRYERMCEDPVATYRDVADFCGLPWTSRFEQKIQSCRLRSNNEKWRANLTAQQQGILQDVLGGHLRRYGYVSEIENTERGLATRRREPTTG